MKVVVKVGGYSIWLFLVVAQNFSFRFNLGKQNQKSLKGSEILEAPGNTIIIGPAPEESGGGGGQRMNMYSYYWVSHCGP